MALKRLVLPAPIDRLPLIAPALVKVLPVLDAWNAARPVMVPELVMFTTPPPLTAMTGVSEVSTLTFNGEEPMIPALLRVVTPPTPLLTSRAKPLRLSRLTPSTAPVPNKLPVAALVMLIVPALPLPILVPLLSRLIAPSSEGSTRPALFNVTLSPVSDSAVPPSPSNTPTVPLAPMLTVTLFAPLLRLGLSTGAPELQVITLPDVVQTASACSLVKPNVSVPTARLTARDKGEKRTGKRLAILLSTDEAPSWIRPFSP
ncbi:hypothetical protein PSRE111525_24590 [Pseudomonas reidholzensis]